MEMDPVSKTLCFLVFFRILDDGQNPKTQKILSINNTPINNPSVKPCLPKSRLFGIPMSDTMSFYLYNNDKKQEHIEQFLRTWKRTNFITHTY
jgi:hypothetical protein